jgi:hypothetical protein
MDSSPAYAAANAADMRRGQAPGGNDTGPVNRCFSHLTWAGVRLKDRSGASGPTALTLGIMTDGAAAAPDFEAVSGFSTPSIPMTAVSALKFTMHRAESSFTPVNTSLAKFTAA